MSRAPHLAVVPTRAAELDRLHAEREEHQAAQLASRSPWIAAPAGASLRAQELVSKARRIALATTGPNTTSAALAMVPGALDELIRDAAALRGMWP